MNLIKEIKKFAKRFKKIDEEESLRREIRKRFPELDFKDEEEMIRIARETGIKNVEDLRRILIERKLEEARRTKSTPSDIRESWSIFQQDIRAIQQMNIPEEEKRKLRRDAYKQHLIRIGNIPEESRKITPEEIERYFDIYSQEISRILQMNIPEEEKRERLRKVYQDHLRRIGTKRDLKELEDIYKVGRERRINLEEYKKRVEEDSEIIELLKNIPEEEKIKLKIASKKEHEAAIRGEPYGLPTGYSEDVKPIEKIRWRARLAWPIHILEPEETRLNRAIPWAKRRLDYIARTKNKEVVLKHKIRKMREYAELLHIKEAKNKFEKIREELHKLQNERKRELERAKTTMRPNQIYIQSLEKDIETKTKELENAEKEYRELLDKLEFFMRETATDVAVLKEILRAEVPRVLEETCKMFHIRYEPFRERIRNALLSFADAEAEKMIQNNFRTIYQSARGFFIKELYRPIGGPFASIYEVFGLMFSFIFEFIFSPIVIGTILLWLLFSIFIRYVMSGPTLAVLIITTIITVFMVLGQFWTSGFESLE